MLRTILTPLRARFDLSPRTAVPPSLRHDDELAPEEFARDVLIEIMRNSVENLKTSESTQSKLDVLDEIHRVMLQDACTKDVFREMDGFVALISVLATTLPSSDEDVQPVLDVARLCFQVISEAMYGHAENTNFLKHNVGYESLANAIRGLVADARTSDNTLGFLLGLALHDFSGSPVFTAVHGEDQSTIDVRIGQYSECFGTIRRRGALLTLWDFLSQFISEDPSLRYTTFKLIDILSLHNHRNQSILSSLGLVGPLFDLWTTTTSDGEKPILQKLVKRLSDMGASTMHARPVFQRALREDGSLDLDVLDLLRHGMKSRWLDHFSLEPSATLVATQEKVRGIPATGVSFMAWIWLERLPTNASHAIFTAHSSRTHLQLAIATDGKLQLRTSSTADVIPLTRSSVKPKRWAHVALVHYPHRASKPSIRIFVDGVLTDGLSMVYPKPDSVSQSLTYTIGDSSTTTNLSWCLASAHLLSVPLVDEILRFIHHLGPRYAGNFQDFALVKFLTYEASTSLNMFLSAVATSTNLGAAQQSPLLRIVKSGPGIKRSEIVFSFFPVDFSHRPGIEGNDGTVTGRDANSKLKEFWMRGDVFLVRSATMDQALWKVGGAAVALRLLQAAKSPHELSRSLGVLTDGLRNSWQNSDDMERLRGYEILADILRAKAQLVNVTGFETLFEFFGINFRNPEHSTITNTLAYRAIALDFELWSLTKKDIQQVYFEHFIMVLKTSRFTKFNVKQRVTKMGLVRKLLFVLQTNWYGQEAVPFIIEALKVACEAHFGKDEAIKPVVSYLAANLHDDNPSNLSPVSVVSQIVWKDTQKAEQVLCMLVSILSSSPQHYTKFAAALPVTRICLLLLAEKPSPLVATQLLILLNTSIKSSTSFIRKFELVSGWSIFKTILPSAWDPDVNEAAFDVLLGRRREENTNSNNQPPSHVVCPHMAPIILNALHTGLNTAISTGINSSGGTDTPSRHLKMTQVTMEMLVEEMMNLHSSSPSFREIFRSQQTTQVFVKAYKDFVTKASALVEVQDWTVRMLEKLNHFGMALALDTHVAGAQKREILDTLQTAEAITNPSAEKTAIDPSLVADARSVRQRIASARLSLQVGERTIIKTVNRTTDWRKSIQISERKRLRKNVLDLRETRRQVSRLYDCLLPLTSERGLWETHQARSWRLDETEGPHRVRKKLEPIDAEEIPDSKVDTIAEGIRTINAPSADTLSLLQQSEVPPWADTYEIASTEVDDNQLAEDIADDKHRRVRHELEPGDVIEAVATVARVAGVDSSPGLLIIGKTHLYMLDGIIENNDGEVIDAQDAPKSLFFVPGSIVELHGPQRAQRWSHDQIATYSKKTFLFRDVGLELYFKDSRSLLVVFLSKAKRNLMDGRLSSLVKASDGNPQTPGILKTPLFKAGARIWSFARSQELSSAQAKWQAREISNFTYIGILNQISGRTPSDATQYPIFPWVLKDYTSDALDLQSPDTYRDLSKPMGALTEERRVAAETRYSSLESVGEKPFHYGTHYSSSMIVCHFLIRLAPFTNMFKTLQGGDWDLPDRLFNDIAKSYESAAVDVRGDVRELIPEFFTCPEFLENSANHDFGVQSTTGERINDVRLPPWAKGDPLLFVEMNRRALESPYVSEHLHEWIDLIWGYKQRDPEALNCFHPLSYEGAVDLDSITDELEREATVGIIHNFGQTPRKLFTTAHPSRFTHGPPTMPIGSPVGIPEDTHLLVQEARCFKDLGSTTAVADFGFDMVGEKILPCPKGTVNVPSHAYEQAEWNPNRKAGSELRYVIDGHTVQTVEAAACTCASFADSLTLVTGCSDYTVRLWKIVRFGPARPPELSLSHIMRTHTEEVTCVHASRPWSMVVSGSKDGSVVFWDLNRGVYVRSVWHGNDLESQISLVSVNESTGHVASCSRTKLWLHTINGRPMAMLDLTSLHSYSTLFPTITSMAFHEREYSHQGILATGGSDGTITLRTWVPSDKAPEEGEEVFNARWEFVDVRTLKVRNLPAKGAVMAGRAPAVTALRFLGESLCHGEETGKAFMWTLPDD